MSDKKNAPETILRRRGDSSNAKKSIAINTSSSDYAINEVRLRHAVDYFFKEKRTKADKIDPKNFINENNPKYTKDQVEKDQNYAQTMMETFEREDSPEAKENKKFSEAFEYVVSWYGEQNNWFGGNVYLVQTSDFDDIANGTDVLYICEQENDAGKVYFNNLLVDITTDTTDGLNKKLGRNFEKIMSASSGAKIKYYENIKNQYKGEISEVIPVVLGLDKENASRLMLDCLEVAEGNKTKKEIENHPASIIFLEEMKRQFEAYSKAIENSPKKTELEKSLMKTRDFSDMITKVLDQKKGLAEEKKTKSLLQTDRFFDALNKRLNS